MIIVMCTGISSDITWIIGVGFVTVLARGFELMKLRFETQVVGKGCDKADMNVIYYEILLTGVALGAWSVTPLDGLFSVVERALNTKMDIKYVLDRCLFHINLFFQYIKDSSFVFSKQLVQS